MLAIERHRRVLALLREAGSLRTTETADSLGVTHETMRKDFELLERRGQLVRIHGGATNTKKTRGDVSLTERQEINREKKLSIAREAAKRIRPNETIFIDASSTALTLTEFLPDFPLTILTNALDVFTALAGKTNYELMCTGGLFDSHSRSFIGLTAEKALHRFNIHRMFFSGNGLHLERGISENNSRQSAFKERVIAGAEDVVFLADSSKLGVKASFFFGGTDQLDCLVTDPEADTDFVQELENLGVEVLIGR